MTAPRSAMTRFLGAAALVAAGAGIAAIAILNPFGLPFLPAPGAAALASAEKPPSQLWTCGMHPQVVQDHPGTCPICHMDLTPMARAAEAAPGERRVAFYRSPMDPMVTSPVPMKDPMGMDYEPVYADDVSAGPEVNLEPGLVQRMNVTTAPVVRQDLTRTVRTVGHVEYDHARASTVTVKFEAYVERMHVHVIGERVRKGQPLLDVYSPALVQTQQDLLTALAYARRLRDAGEASPETLGRADALVQAARERLRLWDISAAQIERVERTGDVSRLLTVTAPASGVITNQLPSLQGMELRPGMPIYEIADMSSVWVLAEVYEDQVAAVAEETHARVTLEAYPGETFDAHVAALTPWVETATRTVRVTLHVANPGGRLRQGMYAQVEFAPVVARGVLVVPSQAVLRTGRRNVAVVKTGEGRFAPREVVLGHESDGVAQVLSGLAEGEVIVTSAQFLIDSESNLRAAVQTLLAGHGH